MEERSQNLNKAINIVKTGFVDSEGRDDVKINRQRIYFLVSQSSGLRHLTLNQKTRVRIPVGLVLCGHNCMLAMKLCERSDLLIQQELTLLLGGEARFLKGALSIKCPFRCVILLITLGDFVYFHSHIIGTTPVGLAAFPKTAYIAGQSSWQLNGLINRVSRVRVPPPQSSLSLNKRRIYRLVFA